MGTPLTMPAFPTPQVENANGVTVLYASAGMTMQEYMLIEMTKALIGRQDSMIFDKDELAQHAFDMTAALWRVIP